MEQEKKIHLKRFTERLKEALRAKTSWGRNQLYKLIDERLIEYLIDEDDLEMEERGAIEALGGLQVEEEVVLHSDHEGYLQTNPPAGNKELPPM